MRMKHQLKRLALATTCGFAIGTVGAMAQNLNNDGGTINNVGDIVFCTANGEFQSGNGDVLNGDGRVLFEEVGNQFTDTGGGAGGPGDTDANRIPYEVLWTADAGTQVVQDRYYTNLTVEDASDKTISDGIFVSEVYDVSGGDRTYNGTFTYDGTLAQAIAAEDGAGAGTNRYNNLQLTEAGAKTLNSGDEVILDGNLVMAASNTAGLTVEGEMSVDGDITQDAAAPLTLDGTGGGTDGTFTTGAGTGDFSGTVAINNGGVLDVVGAGTNDFSNDVDVNDGDFFVRNGAGDVTVSGSMTLANLASATLNLETGTNLIVSGSLANNHAPGVNANFDDASTVLYSGAAGQSVMQTVASNPYGNLSTDNDGKTAAGDVYMSNNLDVGVTDGAGGDLDMDGNTLFMTDNAATVDYDATNYTEVVGAMRRSVDAGNSGPYTFNNAETVVEFTADPYTGYFEMDVLPGVAPNQFDAETDVERKITLDYDNTAWTASIRAGWKDGEQGTDWGVPAVPTTEDQLRFFENPTAGTDPQKVATGNAPTRDNANDLRYVELTGIQASTQQLPDASNVVGNFYASNDLVLRGGPTIFYAINDGRWSNPGTWDEGLEPREFDQVVINPNVTVHVGYRRTLVDGGTANGQREEGFNPTTADPERDGGLAAAVTIEDGGGLLIGYNTGGGAGADESDGTVAWALSAGAVLTNESGAGATTAPTEAVLGTTQGDDTDYPGFINFGNSAALGSFQASAINNTGYLANGGTLRVCD